MTSWRRTGQPPSFGDNSNRLKQPRIKHYGWWRQYNGFRSHPKWKAVADKVGVPQAFVTAVVGWLLEDANKSKPRGSIVDFSALECSSTTGIPLETVGRIYLVLENDMHWIEQEYLVTWDERQKEIEDATNAARQKRLRDKRRKERWGEATYAQDSNGVTPVTVTPKTQTQTSLLSLQTGSAAGAEAEQGLSNRNIRESGENPSGSAKPLTQQEENSLAILKLFSEGTAILRVGGMAQNAIDPAIRGWLRMLDSNAVMLWSLFEASDGLPRSEVPAAIERLVIEAFKRDTRGLPLPLKTAIDGGRRR